MCVGVGMRGKEGRAREVDGFGDKI